MPRQYDVMGQNGFYWWFGVVENRQDPLCLGRCQVRVLGPHTFDTSLIPSNDLPWAYPIQPVNSAAINGIGETPLGPVEGTWVVGFFRDGENAQEPVILGTLGGIPQTFANPSEGFCDPKGKYPLRIDEPDTNRLAVNNPKKPHPILAKKKESLEKSVPTALSGSWDEPESSYAAQYPFNHVRETESGHVEEYDDTQGKERIHRYHKSGTFEEISPNGTTVEKIVGDKYEIVRKGKNVFVKGTLNLTVDANAKIRINNTVETEVVAGDIHINVDKGNADISVNGNVSLDATGNMKTRVSGDYEVIADGDIRMNGKTIHLND